VQAHISPRKHSYAATTSCGTRTKKYSGHRMIKKIKQMQNYIYSVPSKLRIHYQFPRLVSCIPSILFPNVVVEAGTKRRPGSAIEDSTKFSDGS